MAVSHLFVAYNFRQFGPQSALKKCTKNISKSIQDIQDKYEIPGGRRPGPGQGRAGNRLVFCIYLGYLRLQLKGTVFLVLFKYFLQNLRKFK